MSAYGVACCNLIANEGDDEPRVWCGDPKCDGKVHWVHDRYEIACKRTGGVPGAFGGDCVPIRPRKDAS